MFDPLDTIVDGMVDGIDSICMGSTLVVSLRKESQLTIFLPICSAVVVIARTSSEVYCTVSMASVSLETPPPNMILMKSAPCFNSSRTAFRQAGTPSAVRP